MVALLKLHWVRYAFDQPLHAIPKIDLVLEEHPSSVSRPLEMIAVEQTSVAPRRVDPGTSLRSILSQVRGLVVLGGAGSGKTMLHSELARELLSKAETDRLAPVPVILSLVWWDGKEVALEDWVARALSRSAPAATIHEWINRGDFVVLLDGLDEVPLALRDRCAEAINQFLRASPHVQIAVICRQQEYEQLRCKLQLHSAFLIKPLSPNTIDAAICRAGDEIEWLRTALKVTPNLYGAIASPLMLSLAMIAYPDSKRPDICTAETVHEQRRQLFRAYVNYTVASYRNSQRLVSRGIRQPAQSDRITHALAWIASSLERHNQTYFQAATLWQLSCLPSMKVRRFVARTVGFCTGATTGFVLAAVFSATAQWLPLPVRSIAAIVASIAGGVAGGAFGGPITAIVMSHMDRNQVLLSDWVFKFQESYDRTLKAAGLRQRRPLRYIDPVACLLTVVVVIVCARSFPWSVLIGAIVGATVSVVFIWPSLLRWRSNNKMLLNGLQTRNVHEAKGEPSEQESVAGRQNEIGRAHV